mmetsp:Transcript_32581/g.69872  ORF Transcript_32581/g.69872 Transcript_32581/m.69872 type:complete len:112 (+) Transcript_32581:161-496(+)
MQDASHTKSRQRGKAAGDRGLGSASLGFGKAGRAVRAKMLPSKTSKNVVFADFEKHREASNRLVEPIDGVPQEIANAHTLMSRKELNSHDSARENKLTCPQMHVPRRRFVQ